MKKSEIRDAAKILANLARDLHDNPNIVDIFYAVLTTILTKEEDTVDSDKKKQESIQETKRFRDWKKLQERLENPSHIIQTRLSDIENFVEDEAERIDSDFQQPNYTATRQEKERQIREHLDMLPNDLSSFIVHRAKIAQSNKSPFRNKIPSTKKRKRGWEEPQLANLPELGKDWLDRLTGEKVKVKEVIISTDIDSLDRDNRDRTIIICENNNSTYSIPLLDFINRYIEK